MNELNIMRLIAILELLLSQPLPDKYRIEFERQLSYYRGQLEVVLA